MFNLIKRGAARLRSLFFLIIFPKKCLGCGAFDSYFCDDCQRKLDLLLEKNYKGELLVYSVFAYEAPGLAALIHAFKYGGIIEIKDDIQRILMPHKDLLNGLLPRGRYFYLPVPLHKRRLRERGFNQSVELAEIWQKIWPGQILENIIQRNKYSQSQAKLGRAARLQNLKGKFILQNFEFSQFKADDYLVLIDDVVTTGSTLNEIYGLVKSQWPGKIIGLTLARD